MKPTALNLITNINNPLFSPGVTLKPTSLKKNFSSLKKNDFKTDSFSHYFKCSLKLSSLFLLKSRRFYILSCSEIAFNLASNIVSNIYNDHLSTDSLILHAEETHSNKIDTQRSCCFLFFKLLYNLFTNELFITPPLSSPELVMLALALFYVVTRAYSRVETALNYKSLKS